MNWLTSLSRRGSDQPDFTGKVVVIYCSSGQGGGVFQEVRIVRVGFSNFVVGRKVEMEPWLQGPCSNITAWFGINEISQMYIYDDIEAARLAYHSDGP